jgi:ribonuclease Z
MPGVKLTFLGTSSGTPTRLRNVTSQALTLDNGDLWLLDAGEATQHQLMRAGLRASRIAVILMTHLHGDHLYGLPGVLACMTIHERDEPVLLVGPVGLREFVHTVLRLSESGVPFPLEIIELSGDHHEVGARGGWTIGAHRIAHRVACYGYDLREAPRPGRFDLDKAKALGIPAGPLYRRLQDGAAVTLEDGRTIASREVCEPPRPGRHVVLLGDTDDAGGIAAAAQGCDLLVHETTYDRERTAKARQWGHSTTAMTGAFARRVQARNLIITHFSSRYTDGEGPMGVAQLVAETQAECPDTAVHAADDLWSFVLPPKG